MRRNTIRIALQKDGRLMAASQDFLTGCGLRCPSGPGRAIIVPCEGSDVEILYVRNGDIPAYVSSGAADFGIVGENTLVEKASNVRVVAKLGFARCRLVIAVPNDSLLQTIADLDGERIATSYPNTLRAVLQKNRVRAAVVEISGSVEVAPALGLADAICDITQTGTTLKANNLREIATVLSSQAVLIESPFEVPEKVSWKAQYLRAAIKQLTEAGV